MRHKYALPVSATFLQQARFVLAAWTADPNRDLPGLPLPKSDLGRLEGDDVLLLFLESYGAVTYDEPAIARVVAPARDELAHAAAETRPAHRLGVRVVADVRRRLVARARELHERHRGARHRRLHAAADARARDVAEAVSRPPATARSPSMPGMRSAWPEGAFYGFDAIYDEHALDYRGPEFGWWRIPDQFSLARIAELEARNDSHAPLLDLHADDQHAHSVSARAAVSSRLAARARRPSRIRRTTSRPASPRAPDWAGAGRAVRRLVRLYVHVSRRLRSRPRRGRRDAAS